MSNSSRAKLFSSYKLGCLDLPNRIVMAPLTRNRATPDGVPTPLMAEYYAQRASAGLIIAEATQVCAEGQGSDGTPGIYTEAQIAGWALVTHAVHACGGRMFLQLWHVGRMSHTSLQPGGRPPVAPSAIRANAKTFIDGRYEQVSEPRALSVREIAEIVEAYVIATRNALWAGFDGVEIHAANGYLPDQFLRDSTNKRVDEYGGSFENRSRFLAEVMTAVIAEAGGASVGVRISPVATVNDVSDTNPTGLFTHVVEMLSKLGPVYLHVIEGQTQGSRLSDPYFDFSALRKKFHGTYMANNGYNRELAAESLSAGAVDLVAFGRNYIANPDLVQRFRVGAPLATFEEATLYGGGAEGYTDYTQLRDFERERSINADRPQIAGNLMALLLLVFVCAQALAQASPNTPSPLMEEAKEFQMAILSAPTEIRNNTGVYVLEEHGFVKVRDSQNGFNCIVERRASHLSPMCYDAEGSKSTLQATLMRGNLLMKGTAPPEIEKKIDEAYQAGLLHAPQKTGIVYMLSTEENWHDLSSGGATVHVVPHIMVYAPYLKNLDIAVGKDQMWKTNRVWIQYEGRPDAYLIFSVGGTWAGPVTIDK